MKRSIIIVFALLSVAVVFAAGPKKIKAKWFEADISPDVGELIAGYGEKDVSVAKYDNLVGSGICLNDGTNRIVLVSLDLIGLDYAAIKRLRRILSSVTGAPEEAVLVSCTHTHEGPYTSMYRKETALEERVFDETPGSADMRYM